MVTQTIEVKKQTEMLNSLIETYSNKSGTSNYLLNPCQMIPEVDFPPENIADFHNDDKFTKPIWFIPPQHTRFAKGLPQSYPKLNPEVCRASIRKAVCGQLSVAGFTDIAESALVLFTDAIEEFVRNLMLHLKEVHDNDAQRETQTEVEVQSLEKAYYALTNSSLTQVHNFYKHQLVARNRAEISEFNGVMQEYDKLMKESQNQQKEELGGDFLNILEMGQPNNRAGNSMQDLGGCAGMMGLLEGEAGAAGGSIMTSGHLFQPKTPGDNIAEGNIMYTTEALETHVQE